MALFLLSNCKKLFLSLKIKNKQLRKKYNTLLNGTIRMLNVNQFKNGEIKN